jgi:hypothetical protein
VPSSRWTRRLKKAQYTCGSGAGSSPRKGGDSLAPAVLLDEVPLWNAPSWHVPHWEGAELLVSGLREAGKEMPEIAQIFQESGGKV